MSISNNTTKLQSLMDKINALPEAENLDAVISTQDNLISQLQETVNSLPDAGNAGSVPEVATCTIEIINNTLNSSFMKTYIDSLYFIAYEDGEYKRYGGTQNNSQSIIPDNFDWNAEKNTLNNVVCGSMIYLHDDQSCLTPPLGWYINSAIDSGYLFIPPTSNTTYTLLLESPW